MKKGLEYFPMQVSLNEKVQKIQAYYGLEGFAIVIKVWQIIYDKGYYYEWDDDNAALLAMHNNIDQETIKSIINKCVDVSLFNQDLFEKYSILTSRRIQKHFFDIAKRRTEFYYNSNYIIDNDIKLMLKNCKNGIDEKNYKPKSKRVIKSKRSNQKAKETPEITNNHEANIENTEQPEQKEVTQTSNEAKAEVTKETKISEHYEKVYLAWNQMVENLKVRNIKSTVPKLRSTKTWNDKRKKDIREIKKRYEENAIFEMIEYVSQSSFLLGVSNNSKGWRCSFDWCIKQKNFDKIMNDFYGRDLIPNEVKKRNSEIERIVNAWNNVAEMNNLSKVETNILRFPKERMSAITELLANQGLAAILKAINNINGSMYLIGQSNTGFRISFDWLIKPNNFQKVLEGNYQTQKVNQYLDYDVDDYQQLKAFEKDTLAEVTEELIRKGKSRDIQSV